MYEGIQMGNINELEEAYNSDAGSIVDELIEKAKQGSLRISPAIVQHASIEIALLNKHNDIIRKEITTFSSLDGYRELQGRQSRKSPLVRPC